MTRAFDDDEPWRLIVDNPAQPAFMQCPARTLDDYRTVEETPDDLDLLFTSKNHCPKRTVAARHAPDDWIFALISLQTTSGFQGAGHYGIARTNGGLSARSGLGLAPARGGVGAHLVHDMRGMLRRRAGLVDRHRFESDAGLALLWMHEWDGNHALAVRSLDPYFIEICRRVRLRDYGRGIVARTAPSKGRRVEAAKLRGAVGDFWTPVTAKDPKAFALSASGFRYDRLRTLLLEDTWQRTAAMFVEPDACERWRLVARGVAGGQGKTAGWHERTDLTFGSETVRALLGGKGHGELAAIAEAFEKDIKRVFMALRFAVAVGASSGRESDGVTDHHRQRGGAYAHRLHMAVDARFFDVLEARFRARTDEHASAALRREFVRGLIRTALRLVDEATAAASNSVFHRQRATAKSVNAFWALLRQPGSRLHDEPDIAARELFSRAGEDEGDEGMVTAGRVRFSVRDLSRQVAGLEPRQLHALCRWPLAGPGVAAFWHLVRQSVAPAAADNVDKWAALIQALAILARRRTPHPFTYAPARPMGGGALPHGDLGGVVVPPALGPGAAALRSDDTRVPLSDSGPGASFRSAHPGEVPAGRGRGHESPDRPRVLRSRREGAPERNFRRCLMPVSSRFTACTGMRPRCSTGTIPISPSGCSTATRSALESPRSASSATGGWRPECTR